jgi:hypothetical protein
VGAGSLVVDLQDVAFIDCGVGLRSDGEVELATVELFGDVVNAALVDGEAASRSVVVELDSCPVHERGRRRGLLPGASRASGGASGSGWPAGRRWCGGSPVSPESPGSPALWSTTTRSPRRWHRRAPAAGRGRGRRGRKRRDGYAHLAPLFAERVRFPVDHPRQQVPRAELIKGYLPVALHVARKV